MISCYHFPIKSDIKVISLLVHKRYLLPLESEITVISQSDITFDSKVISQRYHFYCRSDITFDSKVISKWYHFYCPSDITFDSKVISKWYHFSLKVISLWYHFSKRNAGPKLHRIVNLKGREGALGWKPRLVTNGSPTGCFLKTSFMGLLLLLGLFWDGSLLVYGRQFWEGSQVLWLTDRQPDVF